MMLERKEPVKFEAENKGVNPMATHRFYTFHTMVRSALLPGSRFNVDQLIVDWWHMAFGDTPNLDVSRRDLITVLSYELLFQGYTAENITMPEKFLNNYKASKILLTDRGKAVDLFSELSKTLFRCYEKSSEQLDSPLNFNSKECIMAGTQHDPQKKAAAEPKEKKAAELSPLMAFFKEQLTTGKQTDEAICTAAKKRFGASYNGNPGYIVICRNNINSGKYGPAPKVQLVRYIDYKGKVIPLSSVPEAEQAQVIAEAKKALKGEKPAAKTAVPAKAAPAKAAPAKAAPAAPAAGKVLQRQA